MSDEQDKLKLSLEPPKLFGRKKKSDAMGTSKRTSPAPATGRRPPTDESASPDEEATTEVVEETQPEEFEATPTEPAAEEPATSEPEPVDEEPVVETEPQPVAEVTPEAEPEPEPATTPEPEPRPAPQKAAKPAPAAKTTPARPTPAKPAAKKTAPVAAPTKKTTALPTATPATKPAAVKPAAAATKAVRPRAKLAPDIEPEPFTRIDEEDAEIAAQSDEPPLLPLYPAAAVTGVVVGAGMVLLIWLSLRGCEAVKGTSSCTGGPGFLLLVATFVLCVLLGSALLKVFSVSDPGSSSFLAVGLVAVMALLFLIDVLDHWSMLIVIPIIGVGAFLASVWVTKTFVEEGDTG